MTFVPTVKWTDDSSDRINRSNMVVEYEYKVQVYFVPLQKLSRAIAILSNPSIRFALDAIRKSPSYEISMQ